MAVGANAPAGRVWFSPAVGGVLEPLLQPRHLNLWDPSCQHSHRLILTRESSVTDISFYAETLRNGGNIL